METAVVYVDVLLVLNYITTVLLLAGTAKLLGMQIKRRRIVGAALLGAVGSLAIFLPFAGFWSMFAYRIFLSSLIVLVALPWESAAQLLKGWGMFFLVNFFFAGAMLGVWLLFSPRGMVYLGGVVYFNINPMTLLIGAVAAYILLGLAHRFSRGGRLVGTKCRVTVKLGGNSCSLSALIDTGNSLYEPFSGVPVIVCPLREVSALLEPALALAIKAGDWQKTATNAGVRIRVVPYSAMGGKGTLPALRVDELIIQCGGQLYKASLCYMAISTQRIGEGGGQAILNPDLIAHKLKMECGVSV
ncbi:MAG: sigma-E processing peptidase SpoIIGA [Oscillospiraceae bacterium]|nr:sigma-E processing peptidase SpoIIGA [Oscillospiraceae bacterium]